MTKLNKYIKENYKLQADKMDKRHDYFLELARYYKFHGHLPVCLKGDDPQKYSKDWAIWESEKFKHWSKVPGVKRTMMRSAKTIALIWVELDKANEVVSNPMFGSYSIDLTMSCRSCKTYDDLKIVTETRIVNKETSERFRIICAQCKKSSRFYLDRDILIYDWNDKPAMFDLDDMAVRTTFVEPIDLKVVDE